MKHPGKIVITDNKVKFEYHKLAKPDRQEYYCHGMPYESLQKAMKEYEASKRVIEVSNELFYEIEHIISAMEVRKEIIYIKDNDSCEAEVENNKAVIVKIN